MKTTSNAPSVAVKNNRLRKTAVYFRNHWSLYLMLLPGLLCIIVFKFLPYYGIQLAFKDYNIFASTDPFAAIKASPWVGMKHFNNLFHNSDFLKVLRNTLVLNGLKVIILFPIPIVFAILLREVPFFRLTKLAQTATYIPYFFSWVVIYGIFSSVLGSYGIVNSLLTKMGFERILFFNDPVVFRGTIIFTDGWKTIGYNTVIFLASIMAIDPTLYEAARMDGANKFQQIWNITSPGMLPTIVLQLILNVGHILDKGFEHVLVFYNPAVYETADIIMTYVYRQGIGKLDFSRATALGLFNSVVAFILIVGANAVSKRTLKRSIW